MAQNRIQLVSVSRHAKFLDSGTGCRPRRILLDLRRVGDDGLHRNAAVFAQRDFGRRARCTIAPITHAANPCRQAKARWP